MNVNVEKIASLVNSAGGRAFLVGGAVIDRLCGRDPKDFDIEVHGLSLPRLKFLLEDNGFAPKAVGESFGVLKLGDIDLSIPRRENRIGAGHRDFKIELDEHMTPVEAARRRDLTINSMFLDLHTGEIVDPFGGQEDLEAGILRATDPETFTEDPLRVLRVMQILPRKGKTVTSGTIELCASLADEFSSLPKERVFEEFKKLLLEADKPSMGLRFLQKCSWLVHFPELNNLVDCPQDPVHHPEGDAWEHTLRVVDNAATVREWVDPEWRLSFMFGTLLHDVGKPVTTDPETLTAHGHDSEGEPIAEAFMRRLTNETVLIQRVCAIVRHHMQPRFLSKGGAKASSWRKLHNKCRLDVLGWMSRCDRASTGRVDLGGDHDLSLRCWAHFVEIGSCERIPPKLMGRHLIAAGMTPGPEFGRLLAHAYAAQLEDDSLEVEDLLKIVTDL